MAAGRIKSFRQKVEHKGFPDLAAYSERTGIPHT
jgi:hypothetical protein